MEKFIISKSRVFDIVDRFVFSIIYNSGSYIRGVGLYYCRLSAADERIEDHDDKSADFHE